MADILASRNSAGNVGTVGPGRPWAGPARSGDRRAPIMVLKGTWSDGPALNGAV